MPALLPFFISSLRKIIFAGQKLNLDIGLTAEKTTKPETATSQEKTTAVTDPIAQQAQTAANERIGFNNITNYDDLNRLATSSVSIFSSDVKTDEQRQQAYTAYSEQLLKEYYAKLQQKNSAKKKQKVL